MRIALYENLPSGGAKRATVEYARVLSSHGHIVDWWTTDAADSTFLSATEVANRRVCYPWPQRRTPARSIPFLHGYRLAAEDVGRLQRIEETARHMAAEIDQQGYDVVFAHTCQPVQGPYLLRFLRTPSVYYCQEPTRIFYDPPIYRPYHHPPLRRRDMLRTRWYAPAGLLETRLRRQADIVNVRQATAIVANSYFSAESIYRAYRRRALVSYLGINVDLFRPLDVPRDDYVLSVGALSPTKGYDFLVASLGCLPAVRRPRLMIACNVFYKPEHDYVQKLAARWGVSVEVRSRVTDEELVDLYNRARAFVYAPVLEPFGFAPLEAMACGVPVVAVAEGGVRETVRDGETGLLAQRQPARFAAVLDRLLGDQELYTRLSVAGMAAVRSFWTWEHAYDRLMPFMEETRRCPVTRNN